MDNAFLIAGGVIVASLIGVLLWRDMRHARLRQRIGKLRQKRGNTPVKSSQESLSLRRKKHGSIPLLGVLLEYLPSQKGLQGKLEKAGLKASAEGYIALSAGLSLAFPALMFFLHKSWVLGVLLGMLGGLVLPYKVVGYLGARRVKKFLTLFPDAIEYIVRGLRSGLPVTESMNMVGTEMEEPIGSIFAGIGESVRLGVPLEKALQETVQKLSSTEFNFFITSIILQRETGGNLSEILNNLADVLRKRFMMRMKIKAMSSEAKASAIIVGSLPFIVIAALTFISPGYLDPLVDDTRGNIVAGGAACSLLFGIGIMIKMTKFEI